MMPNSKTTVAAPPPGVGRQRELQKMLEERSRELQTALQRRVRDVPQGGSNDGLDEEEHAEADIQEHIEVALIQMKGETLDKLREALVRLDAGEYGNCAECEDEISEKRLQALPFAVRCKACEELHELRVSRERRGGSPHGLSLVFAERAG